jgi:hypothetical protein
MCRYRVDLESVESVDATVEGWLAAAYDLAG